MGVAYVRQGPGAAQNNRSVCRLIIESTTGCKKTLISAVILSKDVGVSPSFALLMNPIHWACLSSSFMNEGLNMAGSLVIGVSRFSKVFSIASDNIFPWNQTCGTKTRYHRNPSFYCSANRALPWLETSLRWYSPWYIHPAQAVENQGAQDIWICRV